MCYFSNAFKHKEETVKALCRALQNPLFCECDMIVGTGTSGLLVLMPVSMKSNIDFCVIRKEQSIHTSDKLEMWPYDVRPRKYVIIDDLIASGQTVKNIIKEMNSNLSGSECLGVLLYQCYHSSTDQDPDNSIGVVSVSKEIGVPIFGLDGDIYNLWKMKQGNLANV